MSLTIPELALGPLLLPGWVWSVLLALGVASAVWTWQTRRLPADPAPMAEPVFPVAGLGLLGARVGFVLLYLDAYLEAPWSLLDLRDGGWHWPSGLAAILLGVAVLVWRRPDRRPALLWTAGSAGLVGGLALGMALVLGPPALQTLPALPLTTLDGRSRGFPAERPLVLNLWASWCAPCRHEMPVLIRAAATHPEVDVVLLNQGEEPAKIGFALRALRIPDALLAFDPEMEATRQLGASGYPLTLFVDRQGRIVHRHFGVLSAGSIAARIEALDASH